MNKQEAIKFSITIANEMKRSFETPVILLTMKDYAESVFSSLLEMRAALLQRATTARVADIISGFHLEWLQAVSDVDQFKRRIRDTPRDHISRTFDFTLDCVKKRHTYFQQYITQIGMTMTTENNKLLHDELAIMEDMCANLDSALRDKLNNLFTTSDPTEYYQKMLDESEELLNWIDSLSDHLAVQYSQVLGFKFPELTIDLTKTLQQIIKEVSASSDPEAQIIAKELEAKSMKLTNPVLLKPTDDLEITKIIEKIKILEDRIESLKNHNSSAVMVLQHNALYLEDRLLALENLKTSLYSLKCKNRDTSDHKKCLHIFDHLLPAQQRCRLVDDLMKLWTDAICSTGDGKSIISILSVTDIKEIFSNNLGQFTVDKYGRKLYKGDDGILYQLNERNNLVPVNDDDQHIYFYDDHGRFYISDKKKRLYKAYENASEYYINQEGVMLKMKEFKDGKEYWYDNLGRFYINYAGNRVYSDRTGESLVNDGFGNLVRVISHDPIDYVLCPRKEPVETEESKYLQRTVGVALRKCIANVVIHQPSDPIKFLATGLERYRLNIQQREGRSATEALMLAERERRMREEAAYLASTAPASQCSADHEDTSYADSNFFHYETMIPED